MADKTPVVETTKGYEKFLNEAADAVIDRWEQNGGDNPHTLDDLKQKVITVLESVFTEMR